MPFRPFVTRRLSALILTLLLLLQLHICTAHEHHDEDVDSEENLEKPIDSLMWLHAFLQIVSWAFLFPIGMVFGLAKSRWHVPVQVVGFALSSAGYVLGHAHGGRKFHSTAHGKVAKVLIFVMIAQFSLGVYLKLHIHEKSLRPYMVKAHGIFGRIWPIIGWTQMLLGAMTMRGYCMGDATAQCAAHYIMGSAFIAYGILLAIAFFFGAAWLKRVGQSQEWFDSWVILLWGIVNTFTEHRGSLTKWSHKDLQHTMLGVLWWTGGGLGVYLSRHGQRSVVPAVIIAMTGWAMSAHEQAKMISTKVHSMFGVALIAAGVTRIIEICFVVPVVADREASSSPETSTQLFKSFQHLTPFLLVTGGLLFMSATDEELTFISDLEIDHVTYILMMFSLAFVIYVYTLFLINLYRTSGQNAEQADNPMSSTGVKLGESGYQQIRPSSDSRRRREPSYPGTSIDAEAYELGDYEEDAEMIPSPPRQKS